MKYVLTCVFYLLASWMVICGQNNFAVDTGKYRINLPDYWKPGNRVWRILDEKLPMVCEELKGKELCGDDCMPKYTIEFEMSEPVIYNYYFNHISSNFVYTLTSRPSETWEFHTFYGFECSLLLLDVQDKVITRFILVDTNEVWRISHRADLESFSPPPPMRIRSAIPLLNMGTPGTTPYSYINNNREKLAPTRKDMLTVVDQKINDW